jgi:hypothetical protein
MITSLQETLQETARELLYMGRDLGPTVAIVIVALG